MKLLTIMCLTLSSNAAMLDCTYSVMNFWFVNGLYCCTARLVLLGDPFVVNDVSQNHLADNSNSNVTGLRIIHQDIKQLPRDLENFYPNLESIDLQASKVEAISKDDLKGLLNLKQLHLNDNKIKVIESDLFADSPLMVAISFYNNPVVHVAHNVFDNLPELKTLHFELSICCSQGAFANRDLVLTLISRLTIKCPPSFDMTINKILNGEFFQKKIAEEIEKVVNPLWWKQYESDQRLAKLEEKIRLLEGRMNIV